MNEQHAFLAMLAAAGLYTPEQGANGHHRAGVAARRLPAAGDAQAGRYAWSALQDECRHVASTPEGSRNHTLNRAAFRIGQLVALGYLDQLDALAALIDAGEAAGLGPAEAEATARSGLRAGLGQPRVSVELRGEVGAPEAYVLDGTTDASTDAGEAKAMVTTDDTDRRSTDATDAAGQRPEVLQRLTPGGDWIHQASATVPAVWGDGDDVLWACGEPLVITGPTGVGKTSLGGMVIAGRLGLMPTVLDLPVAAGHKKVLVLAMDRPAQIQRAMARLLRSWPAEQLNDRLVIWPGPPPADLARHPAALLWLAQQADADTVVLDSLKDAAIKLSDEETGQGLSRAMNLCVANGVEVLAYHHQRKAGGGAVGKPTSLADVYGSGWITAGAGSVLLLWGSAGDLVVELSHLKQPAGEVGPLQVAHDSHSGRSWVYSGGDEIDRMLELLTSGPQTATTVASWLYGEKVTDAVIAKARRRLEKLARDGVILRLDAKPRRGGVQAGQKGGAAGSRYALAVERNAINCEESSTDRPPTLDDEFAGQTTDA